jgi:hypothetical protein
MTHMNAFSFGGQAGEKFKKNCVKNYNVCNGYRRYINILKTDDLSLSVFILILTIVSPAFPQSAKHYGSWEGGKLSGG